MNRRERQLNQALEAMHFGFRRMIDKPDKMLAELGLSRVHHRILYFIGRNPDCSVNELLEIMQVSKQYLNRPLRRMIDEAYVLQKSSQKDRRVKRLSLSGKGKKLEFSLSDIQRRKFAEIFRQTGSEAEAHWREVMTLLSEI